MQGVSSLVIFFMTSAAFAAGSPCLINQVQLPLCEGPGPMVPKHLPAAVSFPPSQISLESLGSLIINLNRDASPTKIGLTQRQYEALLALDPQNLGSTSSEFKKMLQSQAVTFDSDKGHPYMEADTQYMRDATIYGVDASTGGLRVTRSGNRTESTAYETGGTFCGLPVTFNQRPAGSQSDRGGNVIALPGGACLSAEGAAKEFLDLVCGPEGKRITVGRRGTNLGHVDEIINVVPLPDKEPPCNFAIVMGSHRKFNEVLRKNPDKLFFGDKGL
ncbi:MAG TPA: hypothetical protein PL182_06885 [Pseudobdellovibrionaceae bacterium]|nr:hypothetical protein [Pseudobdellovibrionaceae bacterium]